MCFLKHPSVSDSAPALSHLSSVLLSPQYAFQCHRLTCRTSPYEGKWGCLGHPLSLDKLILPILLKLIPTTISCI